MKEKLVEHKNLLVVSHSYANFIKDQIEQISAHYKCITVLSRYNPISEISSIVPINFMKPFTKASTIDLSNKPSNVNILATPILYIPTDSGYKTLGKKHLKVVEERIQKNNIRFDLIHSHFLWSAGYVGAKLKEKFNVPFIATAHGYDIYDLPFRDDDWKEKIKCVLDAADYIITVSRTNLECLNKLGIKTPVKVIPNGFNSNLFFPRDSKECRKTLNLPLDKKIILTVGSLSREKGHQYLIEAMREILMYRKEILCVIIGEGELKNKLAKQIKKAGMKNHVKLAGGRSHNEIPIWINACDIFVLPSLNEGNPAVMFECLGCGKPFVGTKVGGIPEIITSESYGLLCEPKNPKELSEEIQIALDKEWNYNKIRMYAERFTWLKISSDIMNIYDEVA